MAVQGSRFKDSILNKTILANNASPIVDTTYSGQHGYASDLRYYHANTDYVRRNVIAKLVEAPTGFAHYPNADVLYRILKSLVETHAMSWEGLASTMSVEKVSTAVSGAGEMQDTPSKVTVAPCSPTMMVPEKYGLIYRRFFQFWMRDLIWDPELDKPGIFTQALSSHPDDHLPDVYTMTVCFFEPDPTGRHVNRAWLCGNMFPEGGIEDTGRRDKTASGDKEEYSVQWSALTQRSAGVYDLAQGFLDEMNLTGTSPNQQPAFINGLTANVENLHGIKEQIVDANKTYIPSFR
jgi:hypothetical protein